MSIVSSPACQADFVENRCVHFARIVNGEVLSHGILFVRVAFGALFCPDGSLGQLRGGDCGDV